MKGTDDEQEEEIAKGVRRFTWRGVSQTERATDRQTKTANGQASCETSSKSQSRKRTHLSHTGSRLAATATNEHTPLCPLHKDSLCVCVCVCNFFLPSFRPPPEAFGLTVPFRSRNLSRRASKGTWSVQGEILKRIGRIIQQKGNVFACYEYNFCFLKFNERKLEFNDASKTCLGYLEIVFTFSSHGC